MKVTMLPLAQLRESKTNPRRTFGDLTELADSIREKGVLSPILARPAGDDAYEIVYGHRRFRAARIADLEEIPALVQDMDDKQVLETQVAENSAREDVHPLEEAEAFQRLLDLGYTQRDLAAKVGKSESYISARLKYLGLTPKGREAFYSGKLRASTALLLARVDKPERQDSLLERIVDVPSWSYDGRPMSPDQAADLIRKEFLLRMEDATFDLKDAGLVPAAGPCTLCPKRTANDKQNVLFPKEVGKADLCSDPSCFRQKQEAHWARESAAFAGKGKTVLSVSKSEKVVGRYGLKAGYAKANDKVTYGAEKSWKQLLGKETPTLVVQGEKGKALEVVDVKKATELLEKKAPAEFKKLQQNASGGGRSNDDWQKQQEQRRAEQEAFELAMKKALVQVAAAAESKSTVTLLPLVVECLLEYFDDTRADGLRDVLERRKASSVAKLRGAVKDMADSEQAALALELLFADAGRFGAEGASFKTICKELGVDFRALKAEAKAELEAPAKLCTCGRPLSADGKCPVGACREKPKDCECMPTGKHKKGKASRQDALEAADA